MLLDDIDVLLATGEVVHGWIRIEGERIAALGRGAPPEAGRAEAEATTRSLPGRTVLPGFVDLHVHGGGGATFTGGDPEEVAAARRFHRANGTTRSLASLVSAPVPDLLAATACLADLAEEGLIEGIHLEGPFLSPTHRGAHDPAFLLAPDPALLEALLAAGRGKVRMVTLAPELPGALALVRLLADAGVLAAIGHSNASYAAAMAAVDAGASVATHLGNGMRPVHQREPGIVLAVLERPEVTCELIADGYHLHPGFVRLAFARAPGRVALVTDAIAAAGAPDGRYRLGPLVVEVTDRQAHLEGTRTIAGSTATTAAAFANALAAGIALTDASRAASTDPARLIGLGQSTGAVEVGKLADLVVLDQALRLEAVISAGAWQDAPSKAGPEEEGAVPEGRSAPAASGP